MLFVFCNGIIFIYSGGVCLETLKTIWEGLDWSVLADLLLSVIPALLCITLHELAHGFVAYRLGDPTAKRAGRLTLNPLKHIDPMGLVMMVVFKFGWAKPVPVNMYRFRHPKRGMALTAAAGPLCNLLLGTIMLFLYGFLRCLLYSAQGFLVDSLMRTLTTTAYLSIALAVFNIVPIPPLDGSKVLFSVLSDKWYAKLMRYERYGMIVLFVLLATDILRGPLDVITGMAYLFFSIPAQWGFALAELIF